MFVRCGSRGVKLATVMVGGRRYTTATAIRAFLIGQQHTEPEEVEADLGEMEGGEGQSNGDNLCHQIQPPMEKLLENRKMMPTKN